VIGRAIRTERYRMVEWKKPGAPASTAQYELYDYKDHPVEQKNLALGEEKALARLKEILTRYPEAVAR
jgi:iduronate 2-sulfatase